jgi:putative oxidoreductase
MNKDIALLLVRLTGIGLALGHGWGKISALAAGGGDRFISGVEALGFPLPALFAWFAALAEFGGGIFLALGIGTRVAAAFAGITMFVAAFVRHKFHLHVLASLGLMRASPDVVQGWGNPEMALIYLLCFLTVLLMGGGRFSLDHLVLKRRK